MEFTTIDVVRFRLVNGAPKDKETISPVTIWIGVFPGTVTPTAAHNAALLVLALLKDHNITDIDVDFRESLYMRKAGPRLLAPIRSTKHPLVDVIDPLTPALGLPVSTMAQPSVEGTMALYLNQDASSNVLLGLSCRHVLMDLREDNTQYVCHPSKPAREVLLLGEGQFNNVVKSIKSRIGAHQYSIQIWQEEIERMDQLEANNTADPEAQNERLEYEECIQTAESEIGALGVLLGQLENEWKTYNSRILGHVIRSPPLSLGVGDQKFTEDWAIFRADRAKLGDGFRGNMIDLGTFFTI